MEITCDIVGEPCPQRSQRPRPCPRPRRRIYIRTSTGRPTHNPPYTQPAPRTLPAPHTTRPTHAARPTHSPPHAHRPTHTARAHWPPHTQPALHTARPTHAARPTHNPPHAHKQPRPRPTGIGDEAGARSEIKRGSAHSLTPPAVRPETMYFCRYWNSRMTGTAARTAPAAKMPHGAVRSSAAHMYMPTASVN